MTDLLAMIKSSFCSERFAGFSHPVYFKRIILSPINF